MPDTPSVFIPLALQKKYKIVQAKGGPLNNALPVRANGLNSEQLSAMLPNDTIVITANLSLPLTQIKPYYDSGSGWGLFLLPGNILFTPSPTGQNWCEFKGHLEPVVEVPEPADEYEEKEVAAITFQLLPTPSLKIKFKK
jgi:hypothetical protein